MMSFKQQFVVHLALACLLLPVLVSAAVKLEVNFPDFGTGGLTGKSELPAVITYLFTLAIVAAVLATVVSLIYGGFLYLTSTGQANKLTQAKKRLWRAGLGLFILALSFLLLRIVNPQFLILDLNKVPVETGILFLNEKAYNVLNRPPGISPEKDAILGIDDAKRVEVINQWLENPPGQPRAVYIAWRESDLRKKFGQLLVDQTSPLTMSSGETDDWRFKFAPNWTDPADNQKKYNFEDFELYGLFFLPNANVKVTTYFMANFNRLNEPSLLFNLITGRGPGDPMAGLYRQTAIVNEYAYPDCSGLTGKPCKFKMLDGIAFNGELDDLDKKSAPLSIEIEHLGPGVYLHTDKVGQTFDVLGFSRRIADLGSYGFNDEAEKIEIRNWEFNHLVESNQLEGKKIKNYLTVLYDDAFFKGNLRLFFEKFSVSGFDNDFGNTRNLSELTGVLPPFSADIKSDYFTRDLIANPNLAQNLKDAFITNIGSDADPYGKVNQASSVQVLEMPQTQIEKAQWQARGGCKIHLCAQTGHGSLPDDFYDCWRLTFPSIENPKGTIENPSTSGYDANQVELFRPFNLPDKYKVVDPWEGIEVEVEFDNNIHSLLIEGDCAVVLFENPIEDRAECLKSGNKCWQGNSPGGSSEVFSPYDDEYPAYQDLTPGNLKGYFHSIGRCRTVGNWLRGTHYSCASAVAVFPIKR